MLFEKVNNYLQHQKRRMLKLDGASEETGWLTEREAKGFDFVARSNELLEKDQRRSLLQGRPIGLMEILYDNTISWIMDASRKELMNEFVLLSQPGAITEDTTTANIATFTTALLPAIRRIYANLVAMDLVTVQPLGSPSGYLYWLDHHYESSQGGATADDRLDESQDVSDYADSGEQSTIYEIYFKLTSKLITTESKKVSGTWTIEAEQDLRSMWKLDLEGELIPELANLIIREINRKIANVLIGGAGAGDTEWNKNAPAGDTSTSDKNAYWQTLYHAIAKSNSLIFQKKFMNATWLMMNGNTYYYFQRLNNYEGTALIENQLANIESLTYAGTLNKMYKVYIDPFMADDLIVMGIRGADWKRAVGYYAPYIPLFLSDTYIYNNDFTQRRRGAMTRYAYGIIPETSTQNPVKNNGIATVTLTQS